MLELMNPVALDLGVERRREVAEEAMRAARAGVIRSRQTADPVLGLVGQTIGGPERPPKPKMQPTSDCI